MAEQPPSSRISLANEAANLQIVELNEGIVAARNISEHILFGEHDLRREMADRVVRLFAMVNGAMLLALIVVFLADTWLVRTGVEKPGERLLDPGVLKVLIGATTVQLGAAVAVIMAYLFPRGARSDGRISADQ